VISFIAMVDDKAGVTLPPNKISACKTVNDLVALVC
jgi:acyl carrier protein